MSSTTEYSLEELSSLVGIEARTIRSYFERGLLQGADRPGPKARYGQYHLDRLRAVKVFRESEPKLTLDRIRMLLQSMSASNIRKIANDGHYQSDGTEFGNEDWTSAHQALIAKPKSPAKQRRIHKKEHAKSSKERLSALDRMLTGLEQLVGEPPIPSSMQSTHWQEIEITPDLRLNVKGDYSETELLKFRRLANYIRFLLLGGDESKK